MLGLSYWVVPIFSSVVWIAMLVTMLVYWAATGKPHYSTMNPGQTIPYISGESLFAVRQSFTCANVLKILARTTSRLCLSPCLPSLSSPSTAHSSSNVGYDTQTSSTQTPPTGRSSTQYAQPLPLSSVPLVSFYSPSSIAKTMERCTTFSWESLL